MKMLAAIRLRGTVEVDRKTADTLDTLSLRRPNQMVIMPDTKNVRSMLIRAQTRITWGELSPEMEAKFKEKKVSLKPPAGGLKSIKTMWPKGDLGYRGDKINELIVRMMI